MLLLLRVIIYGSTLMLWFLASYAVFDWIGVGNAQLDMTNKSVEDIIALFGNLNTSKFPTELSQVLPQAQSMIGAVDLLQRLPDGRLRLVGWVVDKDEREQPVSVFAIIPTKVVLATRTGKKRDDVASLLKVPNGVPAGFDDVFQYQFDCKDNEQVPFVVAVNQKRQFSVISPAFPVRGC
ncbi:MAG: hypothetical protein WBW73_00620 [Rhodoplanes sp.]